MTRLGNELRPVMILIPAGPFWMGSDEGQDNEKPIHAVWLDSYQLAKYPVTNAEYRIYVNRTGAPEPPFWQESPFSAPAKPVVGVNWFEAQNYCAMAQPNNRCGVSLADRSGVGKSRARRAGKAEISVGPINARCNAFCRLRLRHRRSRKNRARRYQRFRIVRYERRRAPVVQRFLCCRLLRKIAAEKSPGSDERNTACLARRFLAPRRQVQPLRGAQLAEPCISLFGLWISARPRRERITMGRDACNLAVSSRRPPKL